MKNFRNVVISVIVLLMTVNCSKNEKNYTVTEIDGVKTYHNMNVPAKPELKIKTELQYTINGISDSIRSFQIPQMIETDRFNNVYILDRTSSSIKKFNNKGEFIKSIGEKGQGPGELINPFEFVIMEDSIYVQDSNPFYTKYNLEGEFIKNIEHENTVELRLMSRYEKDKIITSKGEYVEKDGELFGTTYLCILNSRFEKVVKFNDTNIDNLIDYSNFTSLSKVYTMYSSTENNIYAVNNSKDKEMYYSVNVYDELGNKKYAIEKNYNRLKLNERESREVNDFINRLTKNTTFKIINKEIYKTAINELFSDKEGRLLVNSSIIRTVENEYDFIVDVFENGVFLNSVKLDIGKGYDFFTWEKRVFFKNDLIFYLDRENSELSVYKYWYE